MTIHDRNTIRITRRLREVAGYIELGMLGHALQALPAGDLGVWEGPTLFLRGQILTALGNLPGAAESFRRAAEVSNYPHDRIAWLALSHCLRRAGDVDGAVQYLGRARGAFPRHLFLTSEESNVMPHSSEGRSEQEGNV
ncbi:tetratricopeptide repeat protein [Thermopirellula anaerolimosa]